MPRECRECFVRYENEMIQAKIRGQVSQRIIELMNKFVRIIAEFGGKNYKWHNLQIT